MVCVKQKKNPTNSVLYAGLVHVKYVEVQSPGAAYVVAVGLRCAAGVLTTVKNTEARRPRVASVRRYFNQNFKISL